MSDTRPTAGTDASKGHPDLATYPAGEPVRVPNTPGGHAALAARIDPPPAAAPDPARDAPAVLPARRRQLLDWTCG